MATIGRNVAIPQFRNWHFDGFLALLLWLFVHVIILIDLQSRLRILSEWFWGYFMRECSARLIIGDAEELREATSFIEARPPATVVAEKKTPAMH